MEKAALGAVLSQIAYCATKSDEREAATRAKFVPSGMFQRIVETGVDFDVSAIAAEAEFPIEIVTTATLVAAVVKRPDLVLVAIRGTQFMYEWKIDSEVQKWQLRDEDHKRFLHTGFFKDAIVLSARLNRALRSYAMNDSIKICVFGHSLGGAVAAILKYWGIREIGYFPSNYHGQFGYYTEHCYTYGAPRVADLRICAELRTYAVRRPGDVIPSVPLEAMGYADYLEQYTCQGVDWRARNAGVGIIRKISKGFRNANWGEPHWIDHYIDDLTAALTP